ncbi:MAG: 50S ribosomal protein L17 [Candidatus Adiutrix sp.]|jgi:large subunit ribosomal protein L17|nr:50S ribosomal protein L17 [Candidatus Adiutrix sp.]
MRHRKANVKLGRTASHRDAMLRNMVTSLFEYDRITTTISKAKALRPLADRMIGLAKSGKTDLAAFRQAAAVITKRTVLDKLFQTAAGRFSDRPCGYTVMVKTGPRRGDAAPMVILELVKAGQAKASVGGAPTARKAGSSGGDRARRVAQSAGKVEALAAAPAAESAPAAPVEAAAENAAAPVESEPAPAGEAEAAERPPKED